MSLWKIARTKYKAAVKIAVLMFAVLTASAVTAAPVFAGGSTDNIIVYDNREKILKIREISFSSDYTSMSVLVENLVTNAEFCVEHEVNTGDTVNEYMEVTATDGMGGVSETVHIENPFYVPKITETVTEAEAVPVTGSLSVSGGSGEDGENILPIITDDETGAESGSFNTGGWASVVDNAESGDKEFFIVKSETGNEFYVMIDREGGNENVYFLNAVTEWDLLGLTQEYEVPNNLNPNGELNAAINADLQTSQEGETQTAQPPEEQPDEEAPDETQAQGGFGILGLIILVLFAGAVGAYFYFFKFKRKSGSQPKDEYLPDNYGDYEDEEEDATDTEDEEYDEYDEDEDDYPTVTKVSETPPINISEHKKKPSIETDNPDTDVGFFDEENFTDKDVGDGSYLDDYGEGIDENDVLSGLEGGDEEDEDNTV